MYLHYSRVREARSDVAPRADSAPLAQVLRMQTDIRPLRQRGPPRQRKDIETCQGVSCDAACVVPEGLFDRARLSNPRDKVDVAFPVERVVSGRRLKLIRAYAQFFYLIDADAPPARQRARRPVPRHLVRLEQERPYGVSVENVGLTSTSTTAVDEVDLGAVSNRVLDRSLDV